MNINMNMVRYEYTTTFLLLFLFCPMVLSLLSQNQTQTMNNLSNLVSNPDWNTNKHPNPCTWKGVTCDHSNSSVIKIVLSGSSLSSQSLPVFCKIETLQHLDVSNNHLNSIPDGFISACGKIESLKLLNFSGNVLSGVLPTFHGFGGLETLDMSFNKLKGSIGLQLDGMVSLKSLNLSSNRFTENIPTNLGRSMVLEELVLSNNFFQGTIPEQILSYKNLTVIDFKANRLSGSIPLNIENLSKLEVLSLSSNRLVGKIPTTIVNITTLVRFAANLNQFTGSVPPGITKFLNSLDLSYNNLSESIPEGLLSPPQLVLVDLSNNKLQGPVPANISPSLVRLRLGGNSLTGEVPLITCNEAGHNLTYMELDNNHLTGLIPSELGSCKKLALLNLAENQLTGALPPELGNLNSLQVLQLQMNKLNGTIPIQISQLQKLSTLNLSRNSLDGPIPSEITANLTLLYLQGNNLNGSIPPSIGNLVKLLELQLGENQLSGDIPKMPLSLQISLNLSSNHFSGNIPTSFSDLVNLEVLDLSNNNFSGEIPVSLTKMAALTQLQLSNNRLSGDLPSFASYVNVDTRGTSVKNISKVPDKIFPTEKKSGKSVVAAILIAIAAAIFVVGVVTLLVVLISRHYCRGNNERVQASEGENFDLQIIQSNLLTTNGIHRSNIDFSKTMEAVAETSNVTLKTKFSTYYKALMPSGSIYFAKKLNWCDKIFPVSSLDRFGKELEGLAKLNNSNVMVPLGYIVSTNNAYVLYEFQSNGSLFDVLHGSMENSLDWASRYSIAVGVAQGLSFLHGCASGPILLLDLSSKSIMLKSLKEPLVGDIEHYKVIDPSKSTGSFSAVAGSVGYIPPEYAYTMRVTTAGNVYSFGVILLELLTGKSAVTEGTELVKWVSRNSRNQDYFLDSNVSRTSQAVRNQMLAILEIALVCVSTSTDARPKMKTVLRMLLNAR
ncbi:LRR receptor-like serine/threonine-protein kinase GSO1 [Vicia villosa]|uniref:LRR receptor-like serine/threonine-protein kinase GSO1 n=1 Tax=Vicia villosa TaxID=3911 RepID=UPI00273C799C|nr:LRR receptor-like serine/threonine-protein kinase GSO1 [Vicia villosa]